MYNIFIIITLFLILLLIMNVNNTITNKNTKIYEGSIGKVIEFNDKYKKVLKKKGII